MFFKNIELRIMSHFSNIDIPPGVVNTSFEIEKRWGALLIAAFEVFDTCDTIRNSIALRVRNKATRWDVSVSARIRIELFYQICLSFKQINHIFWPCYSIEFDELKKRQRKVSLSWNDEETVPFLWFVLMRIRDRCHQLECRKVSVVALRCHSHKGSRRL